MLSTVTFFDTREDLRELTGLPADNHDEALWDAGFDLDDWDLGFVSDREWSKEWNNGVPYYEYWLIDRMACNACGIEHVEHNGKHYYMAYHS